MSTQQHPAEPTLTERSATESTSTETATTATTAEPSNTESEHTPNSDGQTRQPQGLISFGSADGVNCEDGYCYLPPTSD